jgi:excisionase family DNA binding protein
MPQQYYTLEEAARILQVNPEQLKEMARKKEIRAFQDRSGWRFRSQEIDELARERGFGSDPELPLGEAVKAKPGDSGRAGEVFNFSLDESDEVPLGKQPVSTEKPSRSGSGSKKGSSPKSPTKASSDSDVRLVIEGSGEVKFAADAGSKAPFSKGPVSPAPKVGSSKSRKAPEVKDDSGVRIVRLDKPSDSDVKIEPSSSHDSDVRTSGRKPTKKASDSDIRIEEVGHSGKVDPHVTEEIDLDAEQRKAEESRAKSGRQRPKPGSSPSLPTKSPFELSETDMDVNGPAARQGAKENVDSSSDFELKPMGESSSPLEISSSEMPAAKSDDEVTLGEMTGGKGASGINLRDPADSGISLEPGSSDEMDLNLSLESSSTPKPAARAEMDSSSDISIGETDSSSDFDLNVDDGGSSPTEEGSSSEFELSLQEDDASPTEGSSSEFELSLDAEGSDEGAAVGGSDSDSEFELTLDDSGGLSVEQESPSESDLDVSSLNEESGSEVVALDEGDTDLESSEFDLSLEGEESGSQVVPLEDEEEFDEGAATVQRKAAGAAAASGERVAEQLDEDLDEAPEGEEEVGTAAAPVAAAAPADWGVAIPLVALLTTIFLFLGAVMSFELIQGMWGYHTGNKVSNLIIHPIAKMVSGEDKLPEN